MPARGCGTCWGTTLTADRMHARLQAAGERWRAAHQHAADTDAPDEVPLQHATIARHRRRAATLLSVAAVALVALAAGAWLSLRPSGSSQAAAAARLTGTVWMLAGYSGTNAHYDGSLNTLRLLLKDGRIVGD